MAQDAQQQAAPTARTMPNIDPPSELILDNDREINFIKFRSRWQSYYVLSRLSNESEEFQRALLLYTAGSDATRVVESSELYANNQSCETILRVLEQYCVGERNIIHERYKFNSRSQLPGETFDAFYADLRSLLNKCHINYRPADEHSPSPADEMLRDRLVLGIRDDGMRKKLISQGNTLTLEVAVRMCRSSEVTSSAMKAMSTGTEQTVAAVSRAPKPRGRGKPKQPPPGTSKSAVEKINKTQAPGKACGRCGREPQHAKHDCPAKDADCRKCRKKGHYAKMCRSKQVSEVNEESSDDFLFTGELQVGSVEGWRADIEVNGHSSRFKLDTGADGTVVSDKEPWLRNITLKPTTTVLRGPGGKQLQILGAFKANMRYKGFTHQETAYVIANQGTSLLSRAACAALHLISCHVEEASISKDWKSRFPKLFTGLGILKNYAYHISLKEGVEPTCIYAPRSIPLPLREKARSKLDEMVKQGIISPVTEATEWCSGLVTVTKPSGDVRICVDLTGLNNAVKREIHPMATVDESLSQLASSTVFTKLDANSGFWQVKLSETSKKLTTFLSPFGRFCFNRLPFGISSAPEIFSRAMTRILEGIPGVICHMDDILVHGPDMSTHDDRLQQVLSKLQESGLTLNSSKCEIQKTSLTFLGYHIDASGVRPDDKKVSAIQHFPTPTCKADLRRLNGMLNQLARFVPHLATVNAPMRELLKESRKWNWGPQQD